MPQPALVATPSGPVSDPVIMGELTKAIELLAERRKLPSDLQEVALAIASGRGDLAKHLLSAFQARRPNDTYAVHLQAQLAMSSEQFAEAERLLAECVQRLPEFDLARYDYAATLQKLNRNDEALHQLKGLIAKDPQNFLFRHCLASVLTSLRRHEESAECYRELTHDYPQIVLFWLRYADRLRALGQREEAIAVYRKVIAMSPSLGGAYWSLADLKTFRFTDDEMRRMEKLLRQTDITAHNRTYLLFALAKAYADKQLFEKAFEQYARANALRRLSVEYDAETFTKYVIDCEALFTQDFFRERATFGSTSDAPIFVLGMHRAGSTLIEQILSSHSQIEGIGEAPEMPLLARQFEHEIGPTLGLGYPDVVRTFDADALRAFGLDYLGSVAVRRNPNRPFFIDKNPFNFWLVGIIHVILPNAKIVDIRRHPMACCFSNFSMNFGTGLHHTYRQSDLGRYYADYVRLMAHFDAVLPGRIHRVFHEELVQNTEAEVRRLLAYLGLAFEPQCLEFHKSGRTVPTPSSEQVRQPINDEGVGRWRNYEPWLDPLKRALGPVLSAYPNIPNFPV